VKYRHPDRGARIHISAEANNSHCVFRVTDNGRGIPENYREQVFGLFKRIHGFRESGSGIGLALCQKIVERRGGRIWVDRSDESGSSFCFYLPSRPPPVESD
jgi:signal transduction histidine kinase